MAIIRDFFAIRPNEKFVRQVASHPYDVLDSAEARIEVEGNPYSFLHVVKSEVDLPEETDLYDDKIYEKARENLDKFVSEGVLVEDKEPSVFVYKLNWKGHEQTGFVGCFSVDEYQAEEIKKHEFTRKEKEDDRVKHILSTNANTGPVFLTYKSCESLDEVLRKHLEKKPLYSFIDDKEVTHTIYKINKVEEIEEIKNLVKELDSLYIADGHHRAASSARVREEKKKENQNHTGDEEYNFFLAVLFPHSQLKILDYNRVVKDLNGLSEEEFFEKISKDFLITPTNIRPYEPKQKHEFGMYISNKWYILEAKPNTFDENDSISSLDVAILQNNLLNPILAIEDPRTDKRINFVGGIRGLEELENLVDLKKYKVAFSLYPTSMDDLLKVADESKVMPPKSTWFEPKLRSGLFIHKI